MKTTARERAIAAFRKSSEVKQDMTQYQIAKSRNNKTITIRNLAGIVQMQFDYSTGKLKRI